MTKSKFLLSLISSVITLSQATFVSLDANSEPLLVRRLSKGVAGSQSDGASSSPQICENGTIVAFNSTATNLIENDSNGALSDVFVFNLETQNIEAITLAPGGGTAGGTLGFYPALTSQGEFVSFYSPSAALLPHNTGGHSQVFLRDRLSGATSAISVTGSGEVGNYTSAGGAINGKGRFVAFATAAINITGYPWNEIGIAFRDGDTGVTRVISKFLDGTPIISTALETTISSNGNYITFKSGIDGIVPFDNNHVPDIFMYDRSTNTIRLVSSGLGGVQANGQSLMGSFSAGSDYFVFASNASNLVANDGNFFTDIFLYSIETQEISKISLAHDGQATNGNSINPTISFDGRFVAFESQANNILATPDLNNRSDIFVHDRLLKKTDRVSVTPSGIEANASSNRPSISGDGRRVVFQSDATNLVDLDSNDRTDIILASLLVDNCPEDTNKTEPGECGCGVPDSDDDQDGTIDCTDPFDTNMVPTRPKVRIKANKVSVSMQSYTGISYNVVFTKKAKKPMTIARKATRNPYKTKLSKGKWNVSYEIVKNPLKKTRVSAAVGFKIK